MERKIKTHPATMLFALRYALGRSTYAPSIVIEDIQENLELFSREELQRFVTEIEEYENFSSELDRKEWMVCKEYLKEKIED